MSDLNIVLAVVGGCVLAAVVAYNAWVLRKNEPRQASPEPLIEPGGGDVAGVDAVGQRFEPVMNQELGSVGLDGQPQHDPLFVDTVTAAEYKAVLDPLIDAIALMKPDLDVSGEVALAASPPTRRAGSKPFFIEGWNLELQRWEAPLSGQKYSRFQAGVQLANRMGALNEIEFSEFAMKAQTFADAVSAALELPDMLAEVARARELDQFAASHDAQLSLGLRAMQSAWSAGYVQQQASRLGFVSGIMVGRMVMPALVAGGAPKLTLSFDTQAAEAQDPELSALREIALHLDVPQIPRSEQPFVQLRQVCAALAQSMDGIIIDQNGQPIAPQSMDSIAQELEQLYDALEDHDLAAGSPQARRLFS